MLNKLDWMFFEASTLREFFSGLALNVGYQKCKVFITLFLSPTRPPFTFASHCAFDKIDNSWEFIQLGLPHKPI